ncbi:MAG: hypothetical protein OXC31_22420 [Spirochaetaceae bacterium]|nr:hypothetical protein [Spirochaetaceae bacterium]
MPLVARPLTATCVVFSVMVMVVACDGLMPPPSVIPEPEAVEDGSYLTSVLGGDTSDTLTKEGSAALAERLSDADLETLAAIDWTRPINQLVTDAAVNNLLASLAPLHDEHYAAIPVSLTLPTRPADGNKTATLRAASAEDTISLRGAVIARLLDLGNPETDRCALTVDDVRALGTESPPSGPLAILGECVERFGAGALPKEIAMRVSEACEEGTCTDEGTGRAVWAAVGVTVLRDLLSDVVDAIPRLLTGLTDTWEITYLYPNGYTYRARYTYRSDGTVRYEHRNDHEGTPGFGQTGVVSGIWTYYWGYNPSFDPGLLAYHITMVFDTCIQDRPQPESYFGYTSLCDDWLLSHGAGPGVRFRLYAPTDDPDVFLTESADTWHTARRQPR